MAVVTVRTYTLAASTINQHFARRERGHSVQESHDLPLGIAERTRDLGVRDAGSFWNEILDD
ncbi:MAG: hypothetical protein ACI9F9_000581 [Candidatus Paceibacteria bacterium]